MKRLLSLIVTAVLFFSFAVPVNAAIKIIIPDIPSKSSTQPTTSASEDEWWMTINNGPVEDPLTGNSFDIPNGWQYVPSEEEIPENSSVFLLLPPESNIDITYQSIDMWSDLTASQKRGHTRSDITNDTFKTADIADLFEVNEKNVEKVKVKGLGYYLVTKTVNRSKNSTDTYLYLVRFQNGYFYTYSFGGNKQHSLYSDFINIVASATYGETDSGALYKKAQSAYRSGNYDEAEKLFNEVSGYKDASKYITLIALRDDSQFAPSRDIYVISARKHIDFEDTAEVLLRNTKISCAFLLGNWYTASGAPKYADFRLKSNKDGSYTYSCSSSISNTRGEVFEITNGNLYLDSCPTLSIEIISDKCIQIYSYENCKTFTLYRK